MVNVRSEYRVYTRFDVEQKPYLVTSGAKDAHQNRYAFRVRRGNGDLVASVVDTGGADVTWHPACVREPEVWKASLIAGAIAAYKVWEAEQ